MKVPQLCPTLCDPMDYNGILQARILEWVAVPPGRSPGDLPNPGIKSRSPALQVDSLPAEPQGKPPIPKKREEGKDGWQCTSEISKNHKFLKVPQIVEPYL